MEKTLPANTLPREQLIKLIRKWGDLNTDGLLEKDCLMYHIPEVEGFIGYKIESSNAIVFGDPVCSASNKPTLAKSFDAFCKEKHLGVIYTIATDEFVKWAATNLSSIAIEFGSKIIFDPKDIPTQHTGSKAVLVRKKVKHALNDGVVIKEYDGKDKNIEKQINEIGDLWVSKRRGPQVYLCDVALFQNRFGKRWFYAEKDQKVVGFLVLNQLEAQNGWLLNNVMMVNDPPKGLSELLIITTLEKLAEENCEKVLVGPIPSKELNSIIGIGSFKSMFMRFIFKCCTAIFKLDRHSAFWNKFEAKSKGAYLLFTNNNLNFTSIKALLKAYNVNKG